MATMGAVYAGCVQAAFVELLERSADAAQPEHLRLGVARALACAQELQTVGTARAVVEGATDARVRTWILALRLLEDDEAEIREMMGARLSQVLISSHSHLLPTPTAPTPPHPYSST